SLLRLDRHPPREHLRTDPVPVAALLRELPAAVRAVQDDLARQDFDRVAVGDEMLAADALALETGRRSPDTGSPTLVRNLLMDRSRDVDDRRRRTKRKRLRLVVAGTSQEHADQPGAVPDRLPEHVADACERWDGPRRRERVVAGFDLDVRERLEQRRLARVGRSDERDLRSAFTLDRDRVAVHDSRTCSRLLELRLHPLTEIRVR